MCSSSLVPSPIVHSPTPRVSTCSQVVGRRVLQGWSDETSPPLRSDPPLASLWSHSLNEIGYFTCQTPRSSAGSQPSAPLDSLISLMSIRSSPALVPAATISEKTKTCAFAKFQIHWSISLLSMTIAPFELLLMLLGIVYMLYLQRKTLGSVSVSFPFVLSGSLGLLWTSLNYISSAPYALFRYSFVVCYISVCNLVYKG